MPRLRNRASGVVVSVSDDRAAALGSEWEDADTKKAPKKPTGKRGANTPTKK